MAQFPFENIKNESLKEGKNIFFCNIKTKRKIFKSSILNGESSPKMEKSRSISEVQKS